MHTTRSPACTALPRLPNQPPQPSRCPAHLRKHPCVVYAPPPSVPGNRACYTGGCSPGPAHEEVERDECVGEVQEWDGDEAEEGRLSAWWGESGGEVGETDEEGACEDVGSQRDVQALRAVVLVEREL
jgi:hypothetical protein